MPATARAVTEPDRMARAITRAAAAGLDALLVAPGPDLRYLTGYDALPLERLTCLVLRDGAWSSGTNTDEPLHPAPEPSEPEPGALLRRPVPCGTPNTQCGCHVEARTALQTRRTWSDDAEPTR